MIEGRAFGIGALADDSVMSSDFLSMLEVGIEDVLLLLTWLESALAFGIGLASAVSDDFSPALKRTRCLSLGGLDPPLDVGALDSALCSCELSSGPDRGTSDCVDAISLRMAYPSGLWPPPMYVLCSKSLLICESRRYIVVSQEIHYRNFPCQETCWTPVWILEKLKFCY